MNTNRLRRKQVYKTDRRVERRTHILHMARRLAGKVGYEGLTMRELAQQADVSPKTLYNLFYSKDDLLVAALQDLIGIIRRSADEHTHVEGIDHILAVRRSGSEAIVRSPGFANVIVSLFLRARPHDKLVESLVGGPSKEVARDIEHEQSHGHISSEIDAETIAMHLFNQSWSILMAWDKGLLSLNEIIPAEQFSYLTTLSGIATGKRQKKLQQQLAAIKYSPPLARSAPNEQSTTTDTRSRTGAVRRTYRSKRQMDRRANILAAVREKITETGYHGMTMRGLADASGVSTKTLYNIYGSKDDVLLAAIVDLLTDIDSLVRGNSNATPFDLLLSRNDATSAEIRRNSRYAYAVTEALLQAKPGDRLVQVLLEAPTLTYAEQLQRGSRNILSSHVDPNAAAKILAYQAWGMVMLWCKGVVDFDTMLQERRRSLIMTLCGITTARMRSTLLPLLTVR